MSDETPRELTEQEIAEMRHEFDALGVIGQDIDSLLHMARRGARAAMAARLTEEVLNKAMHAHDFARPESSGFDEMRHVLLDALTGAGEPKQTCADCGHPPHPSGRCDGISAADDESVLCECRTGAGEETT